MSQKITDFISSIGVMILGVGLLFFSSVAFTNKPVQTFVSELPISNARPFEGGGDKELPVLPLSRPAVPLLRNKSFTFSATMTAKTAMVVDDQTNTVLYKKNTDEVRSLASITKLMSALVLSDLSIAWTSSTMITEGDADPSSHHIAVGESYTLEDLWKLALVGSSNSAVNTLVRASGLSEEEFVKRMNEKAEALGLNSLRFVEPTGLDSRNMGKAVDILKLLKIAIKDERIQSTLSLSECYADPINKKERRRVWSTNWLLTNWIPNTFDKDILVGKTGYIDQSGYNFVVKIPGKKTHVIRVLIMGASSNEARFSEARDLAEWIFGNYVWPTDEDYGKLAAVK